MLSISMREQHEPTTEILGNWGTARSKSAAAPTTATSSIALVSRKNTHNIISTSSSSLPSQHNHIKMQHNLPSSLPLISSHRRHIINFRPIINAATHQRASSTHRHHQSTTSHSLFTLLLLLMLCGSVFQVAQDGEAATTIPPQMFPTKVPLINVNASSTLFPTYYDAFFPYFHSLYLPSTGEFECTKNMMFTGNLSFGRAALYPDDPATTVLRNNSIPNLGEVSSVSEAAMVSDVNYYFPDVWKVRMINGCSMQKPITQRLYRVNATSNYSSYESQNGEEVITPLILTFDLPSMAYASLRSIQRQGGGGLYHKDAPFQNPPATDPPITVDILINDASLTNTILRFIGFSDRNFASGSDFGVDIFIGGPDGVITDVLPSSNPPTTLRYTEVSKAFSKEMLSYLLHNTILNITLNGVSIQSILDGKEIRHYFEDASYVSTSMLDEEFNRQFQFFERERESASLLTFSGVYPSNSTILIAKQTFAVRYILGQLISKTAGYTGIVAPAPDQQDSRDNTRGEYNTQNGVFDARRGNYRGCGLSSLRLSSAVFMDGTTFSIMDSFVHGLDFSVGDRTLLSGIAFQNFERFRTIRTTTTTTTRLITTTVPRQSYNENTNKTITPTAYVIKHTDVTTEEETLLMWSAGESIEVLLTNLDELAPLRPMRASGSTFPTVSTTYAKTEASYSSSSTEPKRSTRKLTYDSAWWGRFYDAVQANISAITATTAYSKLDTTLGAMYGLFGMKRAFLARGMYLQQSSYYPGGDPTVLLSLTDTREVVGGTLSMGIIRGATMAVSGSRINIRKHQSHDGGIIIDNNSPYTYIGTLSMYRLRSQALVAICQQCSSMVVVKDSTLSFTGNVLRSIDRTQRYLATNLNASILTFQPRAVFIVEGPTATLNFSGNTIRLIANKTGFASMNVIDVMDSSAVMVANGATFSVNGNTVDFSGTLTTTRLCELYSNPCRVWAYITDLTAMSMLATRASSTISMGSSDSSTTSSSPSSTTSTLSITNNTIDMLITYALSVTSRSLAPSLVNIAQLGNVSMGGGADWVVAGNRMSINVWMGLYGSYQYGFLMTMSYQSSFVVNGASNIIITRNRFGFVQASMQYWSGATLFFTQTSLTVSDGSSIIITRNELVVEEGMDVYLRTAANTSTLPPTSPMYNATMIRRAQVLLLGDMCRSYISSFGDVHIASGRLLATPTTPTNPAAINRTLYEINDHQCDSILYQLGQLSYVPPYNLNAATSTSPDFPPVEGGPFDGTTIYSYSPSPVYVSDITIHRTSSMEVSWNRFDMYSVPVSGVEMTTEIMNSSSLTVSNNLLVSLASNSRLIFSSYSTKLINSVITIYRNFLSGGVMPYGYFCLHREKESGGGGDGLLPWGAVVASGGGSEDVVIVEPARNQWDTTYPLLECSFAATQPHSTATTTTTTNATMTAVTVLYMSPEYFYQRHRTGFNDGVDDTTTTTTSSSAVVVVGEEFVAAVRRLGQGQSQFSISWSSALATTINSTFTASSNILLLSTGLDNVYSFPLYGFVGLQSLTLLNTSVSIFNNIYLLEAELTVGLYRYSSQTNIISMDASLKNSSHIKISRNFIDTGMDTYNTSLFNAVYMFGGVSLTSSLDITNNSVFTVTSTTSAYGRSVSAVTLDISITSSSSSSLPPLSTTPLIRIAYNTFRLHKPTSPYQGCSASILSRFCARRGGSSMADARQPLSALTVGLNFDASVTAILRSQQQLQPPSSSSTVTTAASILSIADNHLTWFDLLFSPSTVLYPQEYSTSFERVPMGLPSTCVGNPYSSIFLPRDDTEVTPSLSWAELILATTQNSSDYTTALPRRPLRVSGFNISVSYNDSSQSSSTTSTLLLQHKSLVDMSSNYVGYRLFTAAPQATTTTASSTSPVLRFVYPWVYRLATSMDAGYEAALGACLANTSLAHTLISSSIAYNNISVNATPSSIREAFDSLAWALPTGSISVCTDNYLSNYNDPSYSSSSSNAKNSSFMYLDCGEALKKGTTTSSSSASTTTMTQCFPTWNNRPIYDTSLWYQTGEFNIWASIVAASNLTYNDFTTTSPYVHGMDKCLATATTSQSHHTVTRSPPTTKTLLTSKSVTTSDSIAATPSCDTAFMVGVSSVCDVLSADPLAAATIVTNTTSSANTTTTSSSSVCPRIEMSIPYSTWGSNGNNITLNMKLTNEMLNSNLLRPNLERRRQLGLSYLSDTPTSTSSGSTALQVLTVPERSGGSSNTGPVAATDLFVSLAVTSLRPDGESTSTPTSSPTTIYPLNNHSDLRMMVTVRYTGSKSLLGRKYDITIPSSTIYSPSCVFPFTFLVRLHLSAAPSPGISETLDQVTTTLVTAGSMMTAMPQGVIRASMIASLRDMLRCGVVDPYAEPSRLSNPFMWTFGDPYGGYMRGSLLAGAVVVLVAMAMVGTIWAFITIRYARQAHLSKLTTTQVMWKGARAVMFPSVLLVPVVVAGEMAVSSAVTLMSMPYADSVDIIAGTVVCIVMGAYCAHVVVICLRALVVVVPNTNAESFPSLCSLSPSSSQNQRRRISTCFAGGQQGGDNGDAELVDIHGSGNNNNNISTSSTSDEIINASFATTSNQSVVSNNNNTIANFSITNADIFEHGGVGGGNSSFFIKPARAWPIRLIRFLFVPTHTPKAISEANGLGSRRTRASAARASEWLHHYGLYNSEMRWLPFRGIELTLGAGVNALEGFVVEGKIGCAVRSLGTLIILAVLLFLAIWRRPYSLRIQLWFTIGYLTLLATAAGIICANIWQLSVSVEEAAGYILDAVSIAVGLQSLLDILMFLLLMLPFVRDMTGMKRSTIKSATVELRDEKDIKIEEKEEEDQKKIEEKRLEVPPTPMMEVANTSDIPDFTLDAAITISPPPSPPLLPRKIKRKMKNDDPTRLSASTTSSIGPDGRKPLVGMTRNYEVAKKLKKEHLKQEKERMQRELQLLQKEGNHNGSAGSALTGYRRHQQQALYDAFLQDNNTTNSSGSLTPVLGVSPNDNSQRSNNNDSSL